MNKLRKPLWAEAVIILLCFLMIGPPVGAANALTIDQVVSLKEVPVPTPMAAVIAGPIPGPGTDLNFQPLTSEIVKDQAALIRLGKALFWDMQVGSDGIQACATCHFNSGADMRSKNQISPGIRDTNFNGPIGGDNSFGNSTSPFTANDPTSPHPSNPPDPNFNLPGNPRFKPNYQLALADFPLNDWSVATALVPRGPGFTFVDEFQNLARDTNDVVSSMGMRRTQFLAVVPGNPVDLGIPMSDIFNVLTPGQLNSNGKVRRVEPRNAPTVINAVFNFDNFWDGRASFIFNGVNPFGFRDRTSTLKKNVGGVLTDVFIRVTNSSLASQSVGPPGSEFEMSWAGRSFPDIGKKMTSLRPLNKQFVHPQDSVLGPYSRATLSGDTVGGFKGLKFTTYADMIKAAFQDQWWNGIGVITVSHPVTQKPTTNDPQTAVVSPGQTTVSTLTPRVTLAANQFTQMQFNFSLFFGLAVQAYEATLVSDDTPFDKFMGAPLLAIPANPLALNDQQRLGLSIFMDTDPINGAKCNACHRLPISTGHTVLDYQPDAQGVASSVAGEAIEFMIMGDNLESASYDHGMYNISVRRTTEDLGRAGTAPDAPPFRNPLDGDKPFPLSEVELAALKQAGKLPGDVARFVPDVPVLPRRVTRGAFKVPNLRNIKFSGPYFHNGDSATLRQVVEFYTRGGNFPNTNLHDLAADIQGIPPLMFPLFSESARNNIQALVAFLSEGLTDQRVAFEKAPFDHPQLLIPNGSPATMPGTDLMMQLPAIGQSGRKTQIPTFLDLDPQSGGSILSPVK